MANADILCAIPTTRHRQPKPGGDVEVESIPDGRKEKKETRFARPPPPPTHTRFHANPSNTRLHLRLGKITDYMQTSTTQSPNSLATILTNDNRNGKGLCAGGGGSEGGEAKGAARPQKGPLRSEHGPRHGPTFSERFNKALSSPGPTPSSA